jgi:hypothetical protein
MCECPQFNFLTVQEAAGRLNAIVAPDTSPPSSTPIVPMDKRPEGSSAWRPHERESDSAEQFQTSSACQREGTT